MDKFLEQYFDENDVTNEREVALSQRCLEFKNIITESRVLLTALAAVDLFELYLLGFGAIVSHDNMLWLGMLIYIAKMAVYLAMRHSLGNFIGIGITGLFMAFMVCFNLADGLSTAVVLISLLLHLTRIKNLYAVRVIKSVYGFPSFNGFLIANEAKADRSLFSVIRTQYNEAASGPIMRSYIIGLHKGLVVRVLRVLSIVILIIGLTFYYYSSRVLKELDAAVPFEPGMELSDGKTVSGTAEFLYRQLNITVSANVNDNYWARFGDKETGTYVAISVPRVLKDDFASLYNANAPADMTSMRIIYYQGYRTNTYENDQPLPFVGYIREDKARDDIEINTGMLTEKNIENYIDGYYIELVNKGTYTARRQTGEVLTFGGAILILLSNVLFYINRQEIKEI